MRKTSLFLLAMLCGLGLFAVEPPHRATALSIDHPPILDGRLDEPFWRQAETRGDFYVFGSQDKQVQSTTIKVARDNAWLYFGIKCDNPHLRWLEPKRKSHDDGAVGQDDGVELFIDPAGNGRVYFHYQLSYDNVRAEKIVRSGVPDISWNFPWLSATTRDAEGWSAEIAIPLHLLISYGKPEQFTFNVARHQRLVDQRDGAGEVLSEIVTHSSWRPVNKTFHEPTSFAPLTITAPEKPVAPMLASLEGVKIRPYEVKDAKTFYIVEATVKGTSDQSGKFELHACDQPMHGEATESRKQFIHKGLVPEVVTLEVPVMSVGNRSVAITLRDPVNDWELGRVKLENPPSLDIMSAYFDRNYYTDETMASVSAKINLPPESLKNMKVVVLDGNRALGESAATAEALVPFAIKSLPIGARPLTVSLRRADGQSFFSIDMILTKRAPKPGHEWKIDHINRVVLDNGNPFFKISLVFYDTGLDEAITRQIAEMGFNTYWHWTLRNKPEESAQYAALAAKYGLNFLYWVETACAAGDREWQTLRPYFASLSPEQVKREKRMLTAMPLTQFKGYLLFTTTAYSDAQREAAFREYYMNNLDRMLLGVQTVKDADNLVGYNLFDEPHPFQLSSLSDINEKINEVDGYHPTALLFSGAPPKGVESKPLFDIMMQDLYWQPCGGGFRGSPRYVAAAAAELYERAADRRAPMWITLAHEFFRGSRPYTTAEIECETWLALINGATGINYFDNKVACADTWETHKRLNKIMTELAPALTAPSVKQDIVYRNGRKTGDNAQIVYCPGEFNPAQNIFPDVQVVLKRFPDGRLILLAANCYDRPTTCEFSVEGVAGMAKNLFGGKPLPIENNAFADELKGFGVAAYSLNASHSQGALTLTVSSVVRTEDILEETLCLKNYVRPGKKNILPNPSFEDATRNGYPSYFFMVSAPSFDRLIGTKDPVWSQVSDQAFHGKHSLLMTRSPDSPKGGHDVYFYCTPQADKETLYTMSFYAKADKPGAQVALHSQYGGETFNLSTEWKRHSMIWKVPAGSGDSIMRFQIQPPWFGKVWMDAVQVEKGTEMTAFEE